MKEKQTDEWLLYEQGKDYNTRVGWYETIDLNERMYAGDQWNGVVSNGLPQPVFNVFRRCINYFISAIMSQKVTATFIPENIPEDSEDEREIEITQAAKLISNYSGVLWEKLKMDSHLRQALLDAAITGDMCGHVYWDSNIKTGQKIEGVEIEGDIAFEMIDNVIFGNPNDSRVEPQPWLIIPFRELVSKLKKEAKANKVSEQDILNITSDTDNKEQSGDLGKIEMEGKGESGKTTVLIKYWRDTETGTIHYTKSTKSCVIVKDTDMGITRYPIAHNNWDKRKNSYHGLAVGTNLVPNQIYINKMFAMVMLNLMNTAFPKVVYNQTYIDKWKNQIGEAIGVQAGEDMSKVAHYLQPGQMSSQIMGTIDAAINFTKDFIGVTDTALGDIKPDNTSAIIAVQQASFIPLETIKQNLYQFVEDIEYIKADMMVAKYGERKITVIEQGKRVVKTLDFSTLKDVILKIKIDVGASSYWSEITEMQTLDHLLRQERINFLQWLERVPDGYIPKKDDLMAEIREQMETPPPPRTTPPSVSINFADLPINAQIQLAAQMGIEITPQDYGGAPGQTGGNTDIFDQLPPEAQDELARTMKENPQEAQALIEQTVSQV